MESLFGPDGKVNRALGFVRNLMVLGLIALICCIPVVTIGASLTALNYVALRIARGEEGYIVRDFFRSFRESFRSATIIWMGMLALLVLFAMDFYIMNHSATAYPDVMKIVLAVALAAVLLVMTYMFPMISKFQYSIKGYIRNGVMMTILNLPRAIVMLALYALPSVIGGYFFEIMPLTLIFGLSLPAWLSARFLYGRYFQGLEEKIR